MQFTHHLAARLAAILALSACTASAALAQNFPNKPLRILTGDPGGASDLITRLSAEALTRNLGQPAVVINRAGIQVIPVMESAKAPADGYTLLSVGANQFWLAPFLQEDVPYDPVKDFAPVSLTATTPNLLLVHPSVQANNVKELIALARARPNTLNYGIGNYGSSTHLAGQLFQSLSQTTFVTVPYKGTPPALQALLAGEIQIVFPTVSSGMTFVKSGKLKALAVTSAHASPLAPGIPSVNDSGLPGYESILSYAVFVVAKTPPAIVDVLNKAIVSYLQAPDIKEKMFNAGLDIVASSPRDLGIAMKQDMDRMSKVIREAKIKPQN